MSLLSSLESLFGGGSVKPQVNNAQKQQTLSTQNNQSNTNDWRVKISLAPGSNYLYNSPDCATGGNSILRPLKVTNGVIFPYTPQISMNYKANYNPYDLTHSNYKGYFYQSSSVDGIQVQGTFTAQDTNEAAYLLAVIHFFRSATKMFYGQDTQRGAPPPLVYLSGFGPYQFNKHPCVISNFAYNLPNDVDYIRAQALTNLNLNLQNQKPVTGVAGNNLFGSVQRLASALLPQGGLSSTRPTATNGLTASPVSGQSDPTYVPTKVDLTVSLLPMQTRQQVSQQFSLQQFANGNLLRGGFW
jgi:hypothetical protein